MEVWQIVLYAVAGLLALKSLSTLMTAHRARLLAELAEQEEARLREEQAQAKSNGKNKGPHRNGAAA